MKSMKSYETYVVNNVITPMFVLMYVAQSTTNWKWSNAFANGQIL